MSAKIYFAIMLAGLLLVTGCAQKGSGTLQGTATIGPLCPVEPCEVTPEHKAQAYASRKIVVYSQDKAKIVKVLDLGTSGSYRTELGPGTYIVDIKHNGLDRSHEVPKEITIEAGKAIKLDIKIDTGLR